MSEMPSSPADLNGQASRAGLGQRILTGFLWSAMLIVVIGVIASRLIPRHAEMKVLFHAPQFALMDQEARPFSAADLHGKVYICDFIFTTCGSACPALSARMAQIQAQTPASVQLVSFTVNPEHDTPAALKEYASMYHADTSRWHFLTGTSNQMTETVRDMKIGFQAATDKDPILHSQKLLLIDGDNNVRGIYDGTDAQAMKDLVDDATWMSTTKGARGW